MHNSLVAKKPLDQQQLMDFLLQCFCPRPSYANSKKQKLVISIRMESVKKRSEALKIVVGFPGVSSATIEGNDNNQIVVIGEGVDSVTILEKLRKKMGYVLLAQVEEVKKEEKTKEEEKVKVETVSPIQVITPQSYIYDIQDASYLPFGVL